MVIYRPQRGGLAESMAERQEFPDLKQMLEHVVKEHSGAFDLDEIFIAYYCFDARINWETYIVTVTRYGNKAYPSPQAIGYCTFV